MRDGIWAWSLPFGIEREGGIIKAKGRSLYEPAREPAMWRRVSDLARLKDIEPWFLAFMRYGPLVNPAVWPRDEQTERQLWEATIAHLADVAELWKETAEGSNLWELPAATPIEITPEYRRLRSELARVVRDGVQFDTRGLALVPEPTTLDAFLWLSAAESARARHRFKRCERCGSWFPIQRSDARFCSAVCRHYREPSAD